MLIEMWSPDNQMFSVRIIISSFTHSLTDFFDNFFVILYFIIVITPPPSLAFNIGDSVELSELTDLSVCA